HAGVSVGPDGATHQALEDIAALRAFPNITILSPCDANQTYWAAIAAISQLSSPVYIRFGRAKVPNFTLPDNPFVIGKAQIMHEGNDACIIATGHMVWEALQAAYSLEHSGITCRVVNMSTIKPIDKDNIIDCAKKFPFIITVEEHQIIGGLGSAVAETTAAYAPVFVDRIGMRDVFGESGDPIELFEVFNMNTRAIINRVKKNLYHI
ncbi:MAG: transketolase C-terminal domain-containing protein, partial [Bacteroidales bacterium]|nr:transketolase C-terminal domain-containing protein [Bacteroidales bacterium]